MGFSYVIPGLCSASMGMTLGVYEDLIEIFSSFYKFKIIKKHIFLLSGIVIGLLLCFLLFTNLLENYTGYLSSLFVGLVLGDYIKKKKIREIRKSNILYFIVGIGTILLISLIGNIQVAKSESFKFNFLDLLVLSFVSILSSLALILPGISGSMLLYVFGVYEKLSKAFEHIISNLFSSQPLIWLNLLVIIVFFCSFITGILVFSKIIDKFIKIKNNKFLTLINGFLIGSVLVLIYDILINTNGYFDIIFCSIMILIGVFISTLLEKKQ